MDTNTGHLYTLSTRDPPQTKRHTSTESEGLEKDISCKVGQKKAGVAILISYKIDFEIKRQRKTLHNDQRINPRRRYNNYKYICTQHRRTSICKANANKYERGN